MLRAAGPDRPRAGAEHRANGYIIFIARGNHSVSPDRTRTFCIYDGPSVESIRSAARRNGLPVDSITEVQVLDPYFYRP